MKCRNLKEKKTKLHKSRKISEVSVFQTMIYCRVNTALIIVSCPAPHLKVEKDIKVTENLKPEKLLNS